MENDYINADMVEATEFPQLAINYQVRGVPRTVINQIQFVDGMVPEAVMLQMLLMTLGKLEEKESSDEA